MIRYSQFEDDIAMFTGLTVGEIYDLGSASAFGKYYIAEINANINTTQFHLTIYQDLMSSSAKGEEEVWGEGETEMPQDVYYGCLIPMVSDAMSIQMQNLNPQAEKIQEGDSAVWFNPSTSVFKKPERHYKKIYSKYKKLITF